MGLLRNIWNAIRGHWLFGIFGVGILEHDCGFRRNQKKESMRLLFGKSVDRFNNGVVLAV